MKFLTILLAVSSTLVLAQKPGLVPEQSPPITWQHCTKPGHCSTVHAHIVMDSHWRHNHDGILEGISEKDYLAQYGVSVNGSAARMNFITHKNVGSRFYLLGNDHKYQQFHLLGQEFTFDVDISKIPCAVNAVFSLLNMDADGGMAKNSHNQAGARYGTGYCNAQCQGGKCCDMMDLWEANSEVTVFNPHPCLDGTCDRNGCGYNPYNFNHTYYGPGKTVDTNKVITVVTQFITVDGTPNTDLKEIRRIYVQDGKVVGHSTKVHNTLTDAFCHNAKGFVSHGGMKQVGAALKKGMVLSYSLWDDKAGDLKWLDTGYNGPCTTAHIDVEGKYPDAYVVFSNIKVGPIGSTVVLAHKTSVPEQSPAITWQYCTGPGHCSMVHGHVVMDSHFRWNHDGVLEGISEKDYLEKYGVSVHGSAARMNFVTHNNVGSRFYMLDTYHKYKQFHLLGQEFTFDVDISKIPCAVNAALYLVDMEADGGVAKDPYNNAGAKYGTGYCDAQCPERKCCDEMDLWEANSAATVLTPHPCLHGTCDRSGCGYNPYNYDHSYYGPNKTVDTNKVFTVVTQFITDDGTPNTELKEIRRIYVQNGKVVGQSSKVHNTLTDASCHWAKSFISHGGLKQMGAALKKGMVLTYSLWDDKYGDMKWLDTGNNGPCTKAHVDVEGKYPNAYVVFSNIKVGPIGSTYHH